MNHYATPEFWNRYRISPADIRALADKAFDILKANPRHPSIHLKRVGAYRSARVGLRYRVVGVDVPDGISWFWIGTHAEYDKLFR